MKPGTLAGLRVAARVLPRVLRLVGRLGTVAVSLRWHRRRAIAGFHRGLREAGVPDHIAQALGAAYPDLLGLAKRDNRRRG
jgi:hypothetical protein